MDLSDPQIFRNLRYFCLNLECPNHVDYPAAVEPAVPFWMQQTVLISYDGPKATHPEGIIQHVLCYYHRLGHFYLCRDCLEWAGSESFRDQLVRDFS